MPEERLLEAPEHQDLLEAPKERKKPLIIGFLVGLIVAGGITAFLLLHNTAHAPSVSTSTTAPAKLSVTLYYNDGKTVLYEDTMPLISDEKSAGAFPGAVLKELAKKYGKDYAKKGEWKVTTTLDANLQATAETAMTNQQANVASNGATAASFVAEEISTGKVVVWVGNYKNASSKTDFASERMQPGGSIKPFVYAALIDKTTNMGAGSEVDDSQGALEGYPCTERNSPRSDPKANCLWNYDLVYPGKMSLRYALALSRNVPAVKALTTVGVSTFMKTVKSFGVEDGYSCYEDASLQKTTDCYQASVLGDGAYLQFNQEVHAYATLAAQGLKMPQTLITNIELNGSPTYEWKQSDGEQIIRQEAAYIVKDILSDAEASFVSSSKRSYYVAGNAKLGLSLGVQNSGTSANIVGFSNKYAAGYWYGNDQGEPMKSVVVETPLLNGWYEWMSAAHKDYPVVEQIKPSGLQTQNAYVRTSAIGSSGAKVPSRLTDLYPSWYKQ